MESGTVGTFAPSLPPWAPSVVATPLTLPPSQGLYQWIYHTHEDAQEARASQEAPGEDPGGEGAREEDEPDSGNRTGGQCGRDSSGDGSSPVPTLLLGPIQAVLMLSVLY